jgi:hypothetical protein
MSYHFFARLFIYNIKIIMSTARPYAYNTGSTISGATQFGDIAIGTDEMDYSTHPGNIDWWMGPDEEPGYVITIPIPELNQSTPIGDIAGVQFWRSSGYTDNALLNTINEIAKQKGHSLFTNITDATDWLNSSGYPISEIVYTDGILNIAGNHFITTENEEHYISLES